MEEKKTACECPLAGFCQRHGIKKNAHHHKLCQNHEGYFKMWEECRGPGQAAIDCENKPQQAEEPQPRVVATPENPPPLDKERVVCAFCHNTGCTGQCRNKQATPSMFQQAKNFAQASAEHAKSGFAQADTEEQKRRLAICQQCPSYIPEQDKCSECGCPLKRKSAWKSQKCPLGKW